MNLKITKIECSEEEPKVTVYTKDGSVSSIYRFGLDFISYPKGNHTTQFLREIGNIVNYSNYFRDRKLKDAKRIEKDLNLLFIC